MDEQIHRQEYLIRNLATDSVTLYPTRAQIVRTVNEITLKPGTNEITIYGLTPTADESSIKIDGKGSATITDLMIELVDNKERFEDVYSDDSDDGSSSDSDTDKSDSDDDGASVKQLRDNLKSLDIKIEKVTEKKMSASGRLLILEQYGQSVKESRPDDIARVIRQYDEQRLEAFTIFHDAEQQIKDLQKERRKLNTKHEKAAREEYKTKKVAIKEKRKAAEKKRRARAAQLAEKRKLKASRAAFWPKKVYRAVISLETNSDLTPATSRRQSVSSLDKTSTASTGVESSQITLSLSYITNWASWAPRYDLNLNTSSSSGTVTYRAEYFNATSEVWKEAKVILSTSETAFQGLSDTIPTMRPWHIRLSKTAFGGDSNSALYSSAELSYKHNGNATSTIHKPQQPREALFGLEHVSTYQQSRHVHAKRSRALPPPHSTPFGAPAVPAALGASRSAVGASRGAPAPGGLFGSAHARSSVSAPRRDRMRSPSGSDDEQLDYEVDEATMIPDLPALNTQESSWSESGMTTTYDIPGLRTISPSFTKRRHKIASVHLKETHISYLLIPKLRASAFLKARIRNTSTITLLSGPAGLTLDGTFLGNTKLPRCSAGETFSLSLGVDPSINVVYGKPTVRRSQSGIINKEGSGIYTRTCTLTNTKPNRVIEGLLLEQIPISEDERLKVDILQPRGLRTEGDSVRSGQGLTVTGKEDAKWGRSLAVVKKGGEVCFDFKLEPLKGARFVLEYETRYPSGEAVVGN